MKNPTSGENGIMRQLADSFWTFRGELKIAKILNFGTHMSLVRRANGTFLLLDSYDIGAREREALFSLTDGGKAIEAIINVHPFHTLHCKAIHELLPHARMIGTSRHRQQVPEVPWERFVIEDTAAQQEFAEDLEFSVPAGVDLVSSERHVHFASILVRHSPSGIVHVDDTLNVFAAPGFLGKIFPQSKLKFHPTLARALQKRAGAADDFDRWARDLAVRWAGSPVVCAAHSSVRKLPPAGWNEEVLSALSAVERTLSNHRSAHG